MRAHHDILDQPDRLLESLYRSLAVHGGIFGLAVILTYWGHSPDPFGGKEAGGSGVAITPVSTIPVLTRANRPNPVATPTESQVPEKTEKALVRPPEEDAIPIGDRDKKKSKDKVVDMEKYLAARKRLEDATKPNQVNSSGRAASDPMFQMKSGAGGAVGMAEGGLLGNRFGFYAQLVRDCIAQKWDTGSIDQGVKNAPPVTVAFQIMRDGSTRGIQVSQSGGNLSLDYSCQRAVTDCSPFPALPAEFERTSASVEFKFQLKR